jgi:hypothetical protein
MQKALNHAVRQNLLKEVYGSVILLTTLFILLLTKTRRTKVVLLLICDCISYMRIKLTDSDICKKRLITP